MKPKKSNKIQVLISSTALLLILLISVGLTYSWFEGEITYSIKTNNNGDVKTGTAPIVEQLIISPTGNNVVDLNQFDNTTNKQNLHFAEVLSSDGENFFFPTSFGSDGKPSSYRAANNDDLGTKFIKYDFDVKASGSCYLTFAETPTITATKDDTVISDTSAFRIMLKSGNVSHIFTTANQAVTSSVVTDVNGTPGTLVAKPVANYVNNASNKIFTFNANETKNIIVSVWLDGETADNELIGADVELDFKLKAVAM